MRQQIDRFVRQGVATVRTVFIYILLWFLGVPALLLVLLFLLGVGR